MENEEKIKKLKTFDLNFFLGKNIFGDDVFQNMFIYQPAFNTLELQEDKSAEYVIRWKSKGVYTFKLTLLYIVFSDTIKLSRYKIEVQFNKSGLVVEKNN